MMRKNILHPNRPQMMRMRIACSITKATDTHSEYVKLIALPQQQWLLERASMLRLYVHCLSCCSRDRGCPNCTSYTVQVHVTL